MTERSTSEGNPPKPIDSESYRRLVEDRVPDIEIRTCEPITEGWSSYVLEVNGELIFRFPRRPEIAHNIEKEILLLPVLADALPIRVPRYDVIERDRPDGPVVFVGYDKIQGERLKRDALPPESQRRSLARNIGELLSALHSIPTDGLVAAHVQPMTVDGWRHAYQEMFDRAQREVFPLLSAGAQRLESAFWHEFLDGDANFRFETALVHADLGPEHVICDFQHGTVAGIIDWEDAQVGDPALYITGLLYELGEEFVNDVLASYAGSVDQGLPKRARFYARVIPYHQILFGLETEAPAHVRRGLRRIGSHTVVG